MKLFQSKTILFSLLLLLPTLTFAGEIFGTIKKDGKALAKQEVKILQGTTVIGTVTTDDNVYFYYIAKPIGKLTVQLPGYEGATFDVFSTNNSSGYTLSLLKEADKWVLKKQ